MTLVPLENILQEDGKPRLLQVEVITEPESVLVGVGLGFHEAIDPSEARAKFEAMQTLGIMEGAPIEFQEAVESALGAMESGMAETAVFALVGEPQFLCLN